MKQMKKTLYFGKDLLEKNDLFAEPLKLSFNKKGNEHGTIFGGIVSSMIQIMIASYTYILIKRLV